MNGKHRGCIEIYGKTVCIVGCGNVGTECAKRFNASRRKVVGIDLFSRKNEQYEQMLGLTSSGDVLPEADVLVFTLPLTKETRYLMNEEKFALLKNGAMLDVIEKISLLRFTIVLWEIIIGRG